MNTTAIQHTGPIFEHVIITLATRRHVRLTDCARAAGYRRISTFRRFMRAGECTTDQLDKVARTLGTSGLFELASSALAIAATTHKPA